MRPVYLLLVFSLLTPLAVGEEKLLEDFQYGGCFSVADWANTFEDADGRANEAIVSSKVARVSWATKWSGIPSTGESHDFSKFKTYQVDVMVEKGQPVEENANFYFQLINQTDAGYSYWEVFVPQTMVPADGQWHRVQVPIKSMVKGSGDGGEDPSDFTTIIGTCSGMTFDETGDKFKFKRAFFDNVTLSTESVEKAKADKREKPKTESAEVSSSK
ncbi:hypothetical protein [Planctomycetes bacterium K23_9]|uniref:Uncharacterized protein n=1 Tax=Stieleria marina TaxID=1930275 RepID=A0A517NPU3_9BACT|nr:hypothetical protein K239x_10890 [Planctomycetes bacterium K23_9]